DLAGVIDALQSGETCAAGQRVVNIDEGTTAVKKAMLVAAGVRVGPNDLSCVVDALREGFYAGRWIVEGGVSAPAVEEAVGVVASVRVKSDDLPRGVDAQCLCAVDPQGIVDRREGGEEREAGEVVGVIEEAMRVAGGVAVTPHDLARTIDAVGEGLGTQEIVDSSEGGAAVGVVEEAVARAIDGCLVTPDDLAYAVDARCRVTGGS